MNNFFADSIYKYDIKSNIWMRPGFDGIKYSDGDEVEERIYQVISSCCNVSVLSNELRKHIIDWPSNYHFSSKRANLLRPFKSLLMQSSDILEIGSGCGAITRYLGECGGNILALEGSFRRASITRSRTRDLENVSVICENFDQFNINKKFDLITLIGVFEYSNLYMQSKDSHFEMLQKVKKMLKPGGKLIIAIENQIGLKYFAGAAEDHIGKVMYGIENRYKNNQVKTFGRVVIEKLLKSAEFSNINFLAPYPDYKLPISIVTEFGFSSSAFNASNLASESVNHDPQMPKDNYFSMELAYKVLFSNNLGIDIANSFLIVASSQSNKSIDSKILAYHYSTDRFEQYCKESKFIEENNKINVIYKSLNTKANYDDSSKIVFNLPKSANYVYGNSLANKFFQILQKNNWDYLEVAIFMKSYLEILNKFDDYPTFYEDKINLKNKIPGKFFDCIPQNLIQNNKGTYTIIDEEWTYKSDIEQGYLIFRSLINLINNANNIGYPKDGIVEITLFEFIKNTFEKVGLEISNEDFERYFELESEVQNTVAGISKNFIKNHIKNSKLNIKKPSNYNEYDNAISLLSKDKSNLQKDRNKLIQEKIALEKELNKLFSSRIWRYSSPIRKVLNFLKKLKQKIKKI